MVHPELFLLRHPFTAATDSLYTRHRCSTISFNLQSTVAAIDSVHHTATTSHSIDPAAPHTVIGIAVVETDPGSTALVQQQLQHSPGYWRSR